MGRPSRFSPEVRARAVRMVEEHREAHASEWAVLQSVASKLRCTAETLRKWVRQALGPCVSFQISHDEAQDPDGARGGRAHGPDHPPDEPGFQIRELDPTARRSQAYHLSRRSRRAKTGPGHAGHPTMDLYWRTLRVCGQREPTRVGAARHRRAAEHPQPPGGTRRRRTT